MRSRTLLAGCVVAALVATLTGTATAGPSAGRRLAAAPDLLPALAEPKSTPERRAAWESLGPARQQQVRDLFKARVAPAIRDAAAAGQAPRSVRDLVAGRMSDPAASTLRTTRQPVASTKQAAGFDDDADGLPDAVENGVADAFTPEYHISAGELPGTGFGILANGTPQQTVVSLPPVPPVSNFRVQPLGFLSGYGYLRIDYLTLWNRDDGLDGSCVSTTILDLVGIPANDVIRALTGHPEEQERSAILVAAPASAGTYNTDPGAYVALDFFTTAHEGVPFFDQSMFIAPNAPVPAGNHVLLGNARSKHGTYTFNAEGYPIFQEGVINAAYATIELLYLSGIIDYITYLALLFLADDLFFGCVIERFQEQGGFYAASRTNVGEPGRPINASGFIEDPKIRNKLTTPLWIL